MGDELTTRTWLRELARRWPGTDVWPDCPHPGAAQALFAAEHPRLRCVDTLYGPAALPRLPVPTGVGAVISA